MSHILKQDKLSHSHTNHQQQSRHPFLLQEKAAAAEHTRKNAFPNRSNMAVCQRLYNS